MPTGPQRFEPPSPGGGRRDDGWRSSAEIFRDTLSRLLVILTNHKVRFHLTGCITSVAYGEPRMTQDIEPHGHDVRLPAGGGRGR